MGNYKIDFGGNVSVPFYGSVIIPAETREEAMDRFQEIIAEPERLHNYGEIDLTADPEAVGDALYYETKMGNLKITDIGEPDIHG